MTPPNENTQIRRFHRDRVTPIHRPHDMVTTLEPLQPKCQDDIGSVIRIVMGTCGVVICNGHLAEASPIDAVDTNGVQHLLGN